VRHLFCEATVRCFEPHTRLPGGAVNALSVVVQIAKTCVGFENCGHNPSRCDNVSSGRCRPNQIIGELIRLSEVRGNASLPGEFFGIEAKVAS